MASSCKAALREGCIAVVHVDTNQLYRYLLLFPFLETLNTLLWNKLVFNNEIYLIPFIYYSTIRQKQVENIFIPNENANQSSANYFACSLARIENENPVNGSHRLDT